MDGWIRAKKATSGVHCGLSRNAVADQPNCFILTAHVCGFVLRLGDDEEWRARARAVEAVGGQRRAGIGDWDVFGRAWLCVCLSVWGGVSTDVPCR